MKDLDCWALRLQRLSPANVLKSTVSCVAQAGLKLTIWLGMTLNYNPKFPTFTSRVLWLQACVTMPDLCAGDQIQALRHAQQALCQPSSLFNDINLSHHCIRLVPIYIHCFSGQSFQIFPFWCLFLIPTAN